MSCRHVHVYICKVGPECLGRECAVVGHARYGYALDPKKRSSSAAKGWATLLRWSTPSMSNKTARTAFKLKA
jgi:hypothetical protein